MPTQDSTEPSQPIAETKPKPQVRGGFVIIGRSVTANRLTLKNDRPFEHGSRESAETEAQRLAARHGREFAVFQEISAALPPAGPAGDEVVS